VSAARTHEGYITGETLATSITYGERQLDSVTRVTVDGDVLQIALARANDGPQ
jgi:hypothetical protein